MRWTILNPAVFFLAVLAGPTSAAVNDFRLPSDSATQQPAPDLQGPVAPDVPQSRRLQPTPTPTASPERVTPTPVPTVVPPRVTVPDLGDSTQRTSTPQTNRAPITASTPSLDAAAPPATEPPAEDAAIPGEFDPPSASASPSALPPPTPSDAMASEVGSGSIWPWILALAALAILGLGAWFGLQRRKKVDETAAPQVERPRIVPPATPDLCAPAPTPRPPAPVSEPLQVTLEPLRLSLTLMNATLAYRLEIANRGTTAIEDLKVGADMISAHASMTREQQLSGPASGAVTVQSIERIEPGESRIVEGEFRLPFPQIVPIRQGKAALLLPLARFRLEAEGAAPVVRTFAVGQPGEAGMQPFRLDLGPRVYPRLTHRAFA